jgi:signal transduction histidine kinase
MSTRLQSLAGLTRDWRIRTLVPVIVVNLAAFAGLYALMYHFAASNLVQTRRDAASILFDDLQLHLEDRGADHSDVNFRAHLTRNAARHQLRTLMLFDPQGNPVSGTDRGVPLSSAELSLAQNSLRSVGETLWALQPSDVVVFGRAIDNVESCHTCHDARMKQLGALQLTFDLREPMAEARRRVRQKFAIAGLAWIAILAAILWTARFVISRPLKKIESGVGAAALGSASAPGGGRAHTGHDLEALANKLWSLVESQRKREEDIARQMVRAEQLAALGELAAGLTHEIKNPVAGVIAVLELLAADGDALERNREVRDQMLAELRRVIATVESLLRLARPQPPKRSEADLGRIVREVVPLFSARLRRQNVALEIEIADDLPLLPLDASLIVQLLVNLLTNSMQASDRGGRIHILAAPFPHRDGVALAVSDTGRGIAPDQLQRVFDPFFTTKEEGTGLGLAICRQIVEQHGGTIDVESEPGRGTRVLVLFPDLQSAKAKVTDGALAAG